MVEITTITVTLLTFFCFLFVLAVSFLFITLLGKQKFHHIVVNSAGYYSLALIQFLAWTIVVTTFFLALYLVRIWGNELSFMEGLPYNILVLLGISTLVPILSSAVGQYKQPDTPVKTMEKFEKEDHHLSEMLFENGRPSLSRYQMFIWTVVSLLIYIFSFFRIIAAPDLDVSTLTLPDIDPTLVVLMGLSQGAFIGGKLTMKVEKEEDKKAPTPSTP
jgi:hypothetical protein